jgi:5-(carboxyamino)imidazole ribonucleotide mutase
MPAPVAIIMGSQSDWETMRHAAETLAALAIACEKRIVSAHRTPDRLFAFAKGAKAAGFKIIIAGAGGAAHLPGMTASLTELPVFGVPIESKALSGVDSLYSIVQMPAGVPVGTLAIGKPGAINAALLAASVLGLNDPALVLPPGERRRPTRSASARRALRDRPASGEAQARRHHRNSRRRTIGPDAGDGGGAARAALPGVLAGPGFAGVRRGAERDLRRICRCRGAGTVRQ